MGRSVCHIALDTSGYTSKAHWLRVIDKPDLFLYDIKLMNNEDHQKYTGVFKGKLTTLFYIDQSNIIHYDDLNNYSDRYINNAFVGTWASYDGKTIKKVHWGNWRIPYPCGLDVGAGEFHPAVKYLDRGWEFFKNEDNVVKKGADGVWYRQKESDWWK